MEAPAEYECPLSFEKMTDPVIAECGHSFERESIVQWVGEKGTCPICLCPIPHASKLVPNLALKELLAGPVPEEFGLEGKCVDANLRSAAEEPSVTEGRPGTLDATQRAESDSEYEDIQETVWVPVTPVQIDVPPWPGDTVKASRGINPFTGEFDDPTIPDDSLGGLLRPIERPTETTRPVTTTRRVKKEKGARAALHTLVPAVAAPAEAPGQSIPSLTIEIRVHNLSLRNSLPPSIVSIRESEITWAGKGEVPAVEPQTTHILRLIVKAKLSVNPSQAVTSEFTVLYRGVEKTFPYDMSIFARSLGNIAPSTPAVERFNILIFGVAGCGKSSFVNKLATIFEGSSSPITSLAPSGGGERHVTKKLVAYRLPRSHITIWDTWGFNGNYKDETLSYIFEGRLPNNWAMGEMKSVMTDPKTGKATGTRVEALECGSSTAYQRRIHAAILMVGVDDLEDSYTCAAIAERFTLFKEFNPILVVNKIDKPFKGDGAGQTYLSWLRPWIPPAVTSAVSTALNATGAAASTAISWAGTTAVNAHTIYQEKGWSGLTDPTVYVGARNTQAQPLGNQESTRSEEEPSRSRLQEFEIVTRRVAASASPFWADLSHPIAAEIRRVASERCFLNPNCVFLNVNYVEQTSRNSFMEAQTLRIIEAAMERAVRFEAKYGSPAATLPHETTVRARDEAQTWEWS